VPNLVDIRRALKERMPYLAQRYEVASLGVFGSFARHENRSDSDLDLLVTFRSAPSLFGLVELENYLSDLLGVRVDLVVKENLKPHIGKRVLQEVLPV
jgi:predicted nucleotidyltransferase